MSLRSGATRAAWMRDTESASLRRPVSAEKDAARRWTELVSPPQRMALVREIVATRAAELTLAYRNVVAVVAGYRVRRAASGAGPEELHPEPCVIFMTKRKWPSDWAGDPAQCLPAQLLTFGPAVTIPGRGRQAPARVLYAVPTDVQLATRHAAPRAHGTASVRVADDIPAFSLPGTLTCGVQLKGAAASQSRFALSAMHVLSPIPRDAEPSFGADFAATTTPQIVRGVTARWGGHLNGDIGDGFDAQLATVRDSAWFNAAFAPLMLSSKVSYVPAPDLFDELAAKRSFRILVAEGQPHAPPGPRDVVLAQFSKYVGPEWRIFYDIRSGDSATPVGIVHTELLLLAVHPDSPPPVSGDSGSAVVCENDDGSLILVGMYIASGPAGAERDAYVLPAWQLLDPFNWRHLPAGTTSLKPTFSLP